nr:hypothetical protein [Actinomycetota bacterium]
PEASGSISYSSSSKGLLDDVRHLLHRFGVHCTSRWRTARCQTGEFEAGELYITGDSLVTFAERIGIPGKQEQMDVCLAAFKRDCSWSNADFLPPCTWDLIDSERERLGWTWYKVGKEVYGCKRPNVGQYLRSAITRHRLSRFAEAMDSDSLREVLNQDVVWDRVVSVEDAGVEDTYDIEVPGTHNFVADGFVVHNSSLSMVQSATEYIERGKTSLIISLEMDGFKMANRWDAAMAGFKYKALKFMNMRDDDYELWARFAERAFEARFERDVLVVDDIQRCTAERIFTEVERWRPDFFIVDTVDEIHAPAYLKSHWEKQDYAARELKSVCRATKKPGIGVAQAGRAAEEDGATLGNMAGSITIARKADLVVGLHATPAMKRSNKLELRMLKNRDGEGDGLAYEYYRDPASLTLRPWLPSDAAPPPPSAVT